MRPIEEVRLPLSVARAHLSRIVREADRDGSRCVITASGTPMAVIEPFDGRGAVPTAGPQDSKEEIMESTPLANVRNLAWREEDQTMRLYALQILTMGAVLIDTENKAGNRTCLAKLIEAGCDDDYTFCDLNGPIITHDAGWYHVVTCPGAKCAYTPEDWA